MVLIRRVASSVIFAMVWFSGKVEGESRVPPSWTGASVGLGED